MVNIELECYVERLRKNRAVAKKMAILGRMPEVDRIMAGTAYEREWDYIRRQLVDIGFPLSATLNDNDFIDIIESVTYKHPSFYEAS